MKLGKKILPLGSGAYKLHLGHLGPKDVTSHKSRTLIPLFTNRTSFSPESYNQSNKIMKSQKISSHWGLESLNYLWTTRAQKSSQALSLKP